MRPGPGSGPAARHLSGRMRAAGRVMAGGLACLVAVLFALVLAAPAAPAAETKAARGEILAAQSGNTLVLSAFGHEWAGYFRADGTAHGRLFGRVPVDGRGSWRVTDSGQYCVKWNNHWGAGNENCYDVYLAGNLERTVHVSGQGGEGRTFVIRPGNPYGF